MILEKGYNERLFAHPGFRSYYHSARYKWVAREIGRRTSGPLRVLELGCFDAKSIAFLPPRIERYVGIDDNWEGGLDIGRKSFARRAEIELIEARTADILAKYRDGEFNVALSLETLEHIPTAPMRDYVAEISRVTRGPFLVSVPNEMGPVFLAKHIAKRLKYGVAENYTSRDVIAATLRQPHKIERADHKGFDYRALVRDLEVHFEVVSVEGFPGPLPAALSLSVGIIAQSPGRG